MLNFPHLMSANSTFFKTGFQSTTIQPKMKTCWARSVQTVPKAAPRAIEIEKNTAKMYRRVKIEKFNGSEKNIAPKALTMPILTAAEHAHQHAVLEAITNGTLEYTGMSGKRMMAPTATFWQRQNDSERIQQQSSL